MQEIRHSPLALVRIQVQLRLGIEFQYSVVAQFVILCDSMLFFFLMARLADYYMCFFSLTDASRRFSQ